MSTANASAMRVAVHRQRFSESECRVERILLHHVRHLALPFPVERFAVQRHVTGSDFHAAANGVKKRCLAGA